MVDKKRKILDMAMDSRNAFWQSCKTGRCSYETAPGWIGIWFVYHRL